MPSKAKSDMVVMRLVLRLVASDLPLAQQLPLLLLPLLKAVTGVVVAAVAGLGSELGSGLG